jgi:hypothetical protein
MALSPEMEVSEKRPSPERRLEVETPHDLHVSKAGHVISMSTDEISQPTSASFSQSTQTPRPLKPPLFMRDGRSAAAVDATSKRVEEMHEEKFADSVPSMMPRTTIPPPPPPTGPHDVSHAETAQRTMHPPPPTMPATATFNPAVVQQFLQALQQMPPGSSTAFNPLAMLSSTQYAGAPQMQFGGQPMPRFQGIPGLPPPPFGFVPPTIIPQTSGATSASSHDQTSDDLELKSPSSTVSAECELPKEAQQISDLSEDESKDSWVVIDSLSANDFPAWLWNLNLKTPLKVAEDCSLDALKASLMS